MIRVLMRNQNCIDASEIFPDGRKSLDDFPPAQARVNQQSRFTRPDKNRVSRAAARQYTDLYDKDSSAFPLSSRINGIPPLTRDAPASTILIGYTRTPKQILRNCFALSLLK